MIYTIKDSQPTKITVISFTRQQKPTKCISLFALYFSYAFLLFFCVQNKRSKNRKVVSHITYFKHKFFYIYFFFTVGIKIYAANNNKIQAYFSYIRIVYVIYATSCIFHTSATSHIAQCNNNNNIKNTTEIFIYM